MYPHTQSYSCSATTFTFTEITVSARTVGKVIRVGFCSVVCLLKQQRALFHPQNRSELDF